MSWHIEVACDHEREDALTERLVEHDRESSHAVRHRFEPDNLKSRSVHAFAINDAGLPQRGVPGS